MRQHAATTARSIQLLAGSIASWRHLLDFFCGLGATAPKRTHYVGSAVRAKVPSLTGTSRSRGGHLTSLHAKRRFGPWLLGLFLIAQIAGVVPVMFDHAVHVFESQPVVANAHDHNTPGRDGDHRHGIGDVKDECCSLHHHLAGIIPFTMPTAAFNLAAVPLVAPPRDTLASADPILLERPPKSSSLT